MIRRSPTRIELKLDDLQEYEAMRRDQEAKKEKQQQLQESCALGEPWVPGSSSKLPESKVHERIGYMMPVLK